MGNMILYPTILGVFVIDEHYNIIDSIMFKNIVDYHQRSEIVNRLKKKYGNLVEPNEFQVRKFLNLIKDKVDYRKLHEFNMELTKEEIRKSVSEDQLILQAVSNMEEIDRVCNILTKRLRVFLLT